MLSKAVLWSLPPPERKHFLAFGSSDTIAIIEDLGNSHWPSQLCLKPLASLFIVPMTLKGIKRGASGSMMSVSARLGTPQCMKTSLGSVSHLVTLIYEFYFMIDFQFNYAWFIYFHCWACNSACLIEIGVFTPVAQQNQVAALLTSNILAALVFETSVRVCHMLCPPGQVRASSGSWSPPVMSTDHSTGHLLRSLCHTTM